MNSAITFSQNGTITSPKGFLAGAAYAGINKHTRFNLDVAILLSNTKTNASGVFTTNKIKSAPVLLCQRMLPSAQIKGIVVNSGCANASTGEHGQADAQNMCAIASQKTGVLMSNMLVASTGVIGRRLPLDKLGTAINQIELSPEGGLSFAKAIMTTDTRPKHCAVSADGFTIGGVAKGSGMLNPNMATMLSFITTDAPVELGFLQTSLKVAADLSFNMVSVDGDTSPNDSLVILANGAGGGSLIENGSPRAALFQEALNNLCIYLAKEIAKDGEGATRLIEVKVNGAQSYDDASKAIHAIIGSPLVKTAVHGCDPNWGRIIVAAGRSGATLAEDKLDLRINKIVVMRDGIPMPFDTQGLRKELSKEQVNIEMNLNMGNYSATGWGCDLSKEYVLINADYTT